MVQEKRIINEHLTDNFIVINLLTSVLFTFIAHSTLFQTVLQNKNNSANYSYHAAQKKYSD
jgi:hypothetical protein